MLLQRRIGYSPKFAVQDAIGTLTALDLTGASGTPGVLACHPVARGNPYQSLMYGQLRQHGIAPVAAFSLDDALRTARALRGTARPITHLHWLNVFTAKAVDDKDAMKCVDNVTADLDRLIEAGSLLLWTVHNVLPHDSKFPDADVELRRRVVERAGRVHVISPRTPELVSPWFTLAPERTFTVRHPSYADVYPSWITQQQARYELGLDPGATTFVLFGRIAPYKGVTELLDAFSALAVERPGRVNLVVAGVPAPDPETKRFIEVAASHPAVVADLRKIPESEVQLYMRAADVAVLPYRRSLNSGALNLALTFGLPVVLPSTSGDAAEATGQPWAWVYEDEEGGLLEGLRQACDRLVGDTGRQAALAQAATRAPSDVSAEFAAHLRSWLDEEGLT